MRHRNGEESHVLSPIYVFHAEPLLLQARPPEPTCHAGGPGAQAHPEQNEAGTYHFKPFMPTAQAPSSREDTVALPASEAAPPPLSTAHGPRPCLGHLAPRPQHRPRTQTLMGGTPQAHGSRRAASNVALPRSVAHGPGSCQLCADGVAAGEGDITSGPQTSSGSGLSGSIFNV